MRDELASKKNWEEYWSKNRKINNLLYDFIAKFYRKFIIRRALNNFTKKYFRPNSNLLHAGCGSGQVDEDIAKIFSITALDISKNALEIYKKVNKNKCKILEGSILNIPQKDESFDGIYNLGVMEHFTKEEIHKILIEFKRVLKPKAKIILFWPPEFGITVRFLNMLHYVLNNILNKNIRLHPAETTLVKSKKQISKIIEKAGFKLIKYYFGPIDAFTHVIIVAEKSTPK